MQHYRKVEDSGALRLGKEQKKRIADALYTERALSGKGLKDIDLIEYEYTMRVWTMAGCQSPLPAFTHFHFLFVAW